MSEGSGFGKKEYLLLPNPYSYRPSRIFLRRFDSRLAYIYANMGLMYAYDHFGSE